MWILRPLYKQQVNIALLNQNSRITVSLAREKATGTWNFKLLQRHETVYKAHDGARTDEQAKKQAGFFVFTLLDRLLSLEIWLAAMNQHNGFSHALTLQVLNVGDASSSLSFFTTCYASFVETALTQNQINKKGFPSTVWQMN